MRSHDSAAARLIAIASLFLGLAIPLSAQSKKVLKVAADSWMPFNGDPGDAKPGYVVEMLREIFEPAGIKVEYSVIPYKDALESTKTAAINAVIGPDAIEGKDLLLPSEPMGAPAICLLTSKENTFVYENIRSLKGLKLGVTEGYSYWDALDAVIAKGQDITAVASDKPLDGLFTKLQAGDLDVIAESEPVLIWYLRENKLNRADFKAVYRHSPSHLFVAFTKDDDGKAFAAIYDAGVQKLRASGRLTALLTSYGLSDWKK